MSEITLEKPKEESIAAFFYGFIRNAGIFYSCQEGGECSNTVTHNKLVTNGSRFFKKLSQDYFKELSAADIEEISWEIDWWKTLEYWSWEFWKMCIIFTNPDVQINPTATRDFPLRPITEEMSISYLIGLSWFLQRNTENRDQVLEDFLLKAKKTLAPNMTRERLFELQVFYFNEPKIEEMRLIGYDILEMRYCVTGKQQK